MLEFIEQDEALEIRGDKLCVNVKGRIYVIDKKGELTDPDGYVICSNIHLENNQDKIFSKALAIKLGTFKPGNFRTGTRRYQPEQRPDLTSDDVRLINEQLYRESLHRETAHMRVYRRNRSWGVVKMICFFSILMVFSYYFLLPTITNLSLFNDSEIVVDESLDENTQTLQKAIQNTMNIAPLIMLVGVAMILAKLALNIGDYY